jgi:hypothetical protein
MLVCLSHLRVPRHHSSLPPPSRCAPHLTTRRPAHAMPLKTKGKPKAATAASRSSTARATPASRKRQGSNVDQQPAKRTRRAANDNANAGAEEDEDPEEEEEEEIPEEEVVEPPVKGGRRGRVAKKAAPRRCRWARSARSRPILLFLVLPYMLTGFMQENGPQSCSRGCRSAGPCQTHRVSPLFTFFFYILQ